MSVGCRTFGHAAPKGRPIWNDGYYFSKRSRCDADIIRSGSSARWRSVPPGHRVAWRERTEFDIRW